MPRFFCHVSGQRNEVQSKYDDSTASMKANFMVAVEYLQEQPRDFWTRPKAAKLTRVGKGEFRDYFEIRFKSEGVQQRPIGYFGPSDNQFTILIWAIEKGSNFVPADWRKTADKRRNAIEGKIDDAKPLEL